MYFGAVAAQCLPGTQHKLVRQLAYSFLRSCQHADGMGTSLAQTETASTSQQIEEIKR